MVMRVTLSVTFLSGLPFRRNPRDQINPLVPEPIRHVFGRCAITIAHGKSLRIPAQACRSGPGAIGERKNQHPIRIRMERLADGRTRQSPMNFELDRQHAA